MPPESVATPTAATALPTGTWKVDPIHSSIEFQVKHLGIATVKGQFTEFEGTLEVSPENAVAYGTVQVASVNTREPARDEHLRSADFFDAENHPSLTFSVDGSTVSGDGARVTGTLTVRDRARPLSFDARVSAFDGAEVWLDAEVKVNRADFGLTWNRLGMASVDNVITVHAVFSRP